MISKIYFSISILIRSSGGKRTWRLYIYLSFIVIIKCMAIIKNENKNKRSLIISSKTNEKEGKENEFLSLVHA